jgi:hypothetical protein
MSGRIATIATIATIISSITLSTVLHHRAYP